MLAYCVMQVVGKAAYAAVTYQCECFTIANVGADAENSALHT